MNPAITGTLTRILGSYCYTRPYVHRLKHLHCQEDSELKRRISKSMYSMLTLYVCCSNDLNNGNEPICIYCSGIFYVRQRSLYIIIPQ